MKVIATIFILIIISISVTGQDGTKVFSGYGEMRQYFGELYQQKKFTEAAALLEHHIDKFPDNLLANAYNLAIVYGQMEQYDKGIEILKYAHEQDIWFSKYAFEGDIWIPYKELDEFDVVFHRNEELRAEAQKQAKTIYEVVTPEVYKKGKEYPLFIALHGGGSNIEEFRESWFSGTMQKEFITLYVQSSQIIAMNGFNWTEDLEISKKEIAEAFDQVSEDYSINEKEIIVGGFSSGGVAAMEVVLSETIPAIGFIALCPGKPDSFTEESVKAAKKNNMRCTLFTTEFDQRLDLQKEMAETFESVGLAHQFIISPDTGHWFPENFDQMLDDAIDFARTR